MILIYAFGQFQGSYAGRFFQDLLQKPVFTVLLCVLTIQGVLLFYMAMHSPLKIGDYVYPAWANAIGWILCMSSFLWVPACAMYVVSKQNGNWKKVMLCREYIKSKLLSLVSSAVVFIRLKSDATSTAKMIFAEIVQLREIF